MEDVHQLVETLPGFRDAFVDSVEPVKVLLQSPFPRLELKGEQFQTFNLANSISMDKIWNSILVINSTLTKSVTAKSHLPKHLALQHFLETH